MRNVQISLDLISVAVVQVTVFFNFTPAIYYVVVITGRNEVLAKVIFSQACVCPQGGVVCSRFCSNIPGGVGGYFFGGVYFSGGYFLGGVFFGGVFFRGGVFFWGGIFLGGYFLGGYFFGGGVLHQNTVNIRPVRILLECILVTKAILIAILLYGRNRYHNCDDKKMDAQPILKHNGNHNRIY